jgi:hypothetical protein
MYELLFALRTADTLIYVGKVHLSRVDIFPGLLLKRVHPYRQYINYYQLQSMYHSIRYVNTYYLRGRRVFYHVFKCYVLRV